MIETILKKPVKIGRLELQNRIIIQPMEGCDGKADGGISELVRRRYLRFAESGVGLIWFEATAVCHEGRANPRQLYLTEENKNEFADLVKEIKEASIKKYGFSPKIILQMTHSGRQSRPNNEIHEPIFASHNEYFNNVKPLNEKSVFASTEYLNSLPELFVKSAVLAKDVGFDGVDVKCCHGYLFNELLSSYDRTDCYGGESIENRARLYLDTYKAVKAAVGDSITVTSRFGAYDGFPYHYGFGVNKDDKEDLTESYYIIDKLREYGLELLNITIGNPYVNPHVNRPYCTNSPEDGKIGVNRIRRITAQIQMKYPDLAVVMSGMTYQGTESLKDAESCISDKKCTLVGFGRMAFAYPQFFVDYLNNGEIDKNKICLACGNCSKMMRAGSVAGCPMRDKEVYLPIFKELFKNSQGVKS